VSKTARGRSVVIRGVGNGLFLISILSAGVFFVINIIINIIVRFVRNVGVLEP